MVNLLTKKRKGIKRHESLKPLSRHHMEALHVALKLSRAGTEESRLTIEEIYNDLKSFWEPNGQEHFREEEEILLVTYAKYHSIERAEFKEMLFEHVQIRALIEQVLDDDSRDITRMHELGELLNDHVRKEERVIFPLIEESLPEDVLEEIAPYLH